MSEELQDAIPKSYEEVQKMARKIINPLVISTWDDAWRLNVTPWDAGAIQPPLKDVIEGNSNGIEWPRTGLALVPGCGGGYDVVYLASTLGIKVIGLDASQTAVNKATASTRDKPLPKGEAVFKLADFFTYKSDEVINLIYDYTFFVAIPPQRRIEWGKKMAELINPGGYLITLVFPIDPYVEGGSPFYVRPEHYDEPLSSTFEKVVDTIPEVSEPSHVGRERLLVWRRKAN